MRGADYVTVSWNHFAGTDKSMLTGHSDGAASTDVGHLKVSIHHNWFDGSRQRHPRAAWCSGPTSSPARVRARPAARSPLEPAASVPSLVQARAGAGAGAGRA
ncbi:hypothetical protein [Actinoplanes sp. NPDC048796]|uniref:pectate lyase family protein n=1 Tax=Actinoplanes sp. NPDC048796 TaxID=3155640 RepID=UPI0033ED4E0A